jgi:hypothetical protein
VISIREKSRGLEIIKNSLEGRNFLPNYVTFNDAAAEGTFTRLPDREEMPAEINEVLIVGIRRRLPPGAEGRRSIRLGVGSARHSANPPPKFK